MSVTATALFTQSVWLQPCIPQVPVFPMSPPYLAVLLRAGCRCVTCVVNALNHPVVKIPLQACSQLQLAILQAPACTAATVLISLSLFKNSWLPDSTNVI